MVIDFAPSFYFRKEGPGILMGMTDDNELSSFDTHVSWDFLAQVVEKAIHRAPVPGGAGVMDGWGGLYEVTPDDNPILGPLPEVEGLWCMGGFSGFHALPGSGPRHGAAHPAWTSGHRPLFPGHRPLSPGTRASGDPSSVKRAELGHAANDWLETIRRELGRDQEPPTHSWQGHLNAVGGT